MSAKNLFQRIAEYAGIAAISFSAFACPRIEQKPEEAALEDAQMATQEAQPAKQSLQELRESIIGEIASKQKEALKKAEKSESLSGRIYFSGKKEGIWDLYFREGNNITRLTSTPEQESNVAVSSDGKLLAYDATDGSYTHIYIMDLATKEVFPATFGLYWDSEPVWHPNMEEIAFKRYFEGFDSDILTVNGKTGKVETLTKNDEMTSDHSPSYDPEGKLIAYISEKITMLGENTMSSDGSVWIMDTNGDEKKQITKGIKPHSVPRWSPTGDKIVLEGILEGYTTIATIAPDGTELTPLLSYKDISKEIPSFHFTNPSFSPTGEQIIFEAYTITSSEKDGYSAFGIMNSDGSNRRFVLGDFGRVKEPVWVE